MAAPNPVAELLRTMPSAYAQIFEARDFSEHAQLIGQRGARRAHAAEWRSLPGGTTIACIVADDLPGLLSLVSAAFVAHHLDVTSAQIFCRSLSDGKVEAVDFFWLRRSRASRLAPQIDPSELESVGRMLNDLLREEKVAPSLPARELERLAPELSVKPRVFYDTRALRRGEVILNVVTPDRAGLLLAITLCFARQGLEIVASEVRTDQGIASDRFTLRDARGTLLTPNRLAEIQREIIAALRTGDSDPASR